MPGGGSFYSNAQCDILTSQWGCMNRKTLEIFAGLSFLLAPSVSLGQTPSVTPFEKLPDWTGLWSMMGGTVFDTATQTGKGGVVTHGVREHPPYTPAFEKIYE